MAQVNLTLPVPGDVVTAAGANANFGAFGVSINNTNIATDTFENYHLPQSTTMPHAQAVGLYSADIVENGSYTIGNYIANGTSQLINHGAGALQIAGPFTVPNNTILFVSWKQHITSWSTYAGPGPAATPQDLDSYFRVKAQINGGGSADLVTGYFSWVSGYNHQNGVVPGYVYDANAITVAGCIAYENTSGSNQTITNLQLEVAPNAVGGGNIDFQINLQQGLLSYIIIRK